MLDLNTQIYHVNIPTSCLPPEMSIRRAKILLYMYAFIKAKGLSPTLREIGEAVDISSTSVVKYNLDRLIDQGYIRSHDTISRGLIMRPQGYQFVYSIHPDEEDMNPFSEVRQLKRENSYIKQQYEQQITELLAERDELMAQLQKVRDAIFN